MLGSRRASTVGPEGRLRSVHKSGPCHLQMTRLPPLQTHLLGSPAQLAAKSLPLISGRLSPRAGASGRAFDHRRFQVKLCGVGGSLPLGPIHPATFIGLGNSEGGSCERFVSHPKPPSLCSLVASAACYSLRVLQRRCHSIFLRRHLGMLAVLLVSFLAPLVPVVSCRYPPWSSKHFDTSTVRSPSVTVLCALVL